MHIRIALRKSPLTVAIALLPIPITIVALNVAGMRIWPRYFFIEIEVLYLFLVVGVMATAVVVTSWLRSAVFTKLPDSALAGIAIVAMVGGSVLMLTGTYRYPKQDPAGAVAEVERRAQPGDIRATYGVGAETIHWAGRRDSPHLHLAAADAFLLPSRWESLPITIVEAFQHGLLVIATDTGGVRELVDDSVGRVSSIGDVAALAQHCLEIACDDALARRLSEAALSRSRELRFDPAHMNGVMEQLYFDIVAGRGSAQQQGEAR